MKLFVFAFFILFTMPFTTMARSVDDYQSTVILKGKYLQDYQVFDTFLYLITVDPHAKWRGDDLGFNIEDERELKGFQRFQEKMKLVHARLNRALDNSWYKINCTSKESFSNKNREKIIRDMDTVEDLQEEVAKKHLSKALKSMSKETRLNVINYLQDLKNTTTITMISNEEFHDTASVDAMKLDFATKCVNDSYEYHSELSWTAITRRL